MIEPTFELLFPTPVMFTELNREFTKKELNFVSKNGKEEMTNKNIGNVTSNNNYILEAPELENLKKYITATINQYIKKVYKPKYDVQGFITQSWLNYTNKGEFHHKHEHPNSFVSGVLYIQTDETKDKITFHKSGYKQLQLATDTFDIYNSDSWWFNVKNRGIVLFPSSLTHHVENVTADETRISLAFNTFIKGTFGDNKALTELKND
jgi:uncharacterized protein (TIGR02466 family)